jgi:hypothetical protein
VFSARINESEIRCACGKVADAIAYAKHRSRAHDAVIHIYDEAGKEIAKKARRFVIHEKDHREPIARRALAALLCNKQL